MGKFGSALDALNPEGRQNRIKRRDEQRAREMRAEKRLAGSVLEEGKSLLVRGVLKVVGAFDLTGTLSMKSGDGTELIRMGDMTFGRGLEFKRDDGTRAFGFRRAFDNSSAQDWFWQDRSGNVVIAENDLGPGLRKPNLEHPFQPVAAASGTAVACGPYGWERATSSGTWTTLFVYDGLHQNRFLDLKVAAKCSDATTAAELRVVDEDTGTPLSGFFRPPWLGVVPAGTTAMTVVDPAPADVATPNAVGAYMRIGIQARVTAGAGSVTVAIPQAIGS